ncbi:MAG: hypothetical protein KBC62_01405 [Candidatus Pacebacteria bacterium]|nr:hypothetical protein [Candidatus Paceibacterota bacterium]
MNQLHNGKPNIGVYRKQDFATYVTWKSLPTFLRGQPETVLRKMGIDDDMAIELLQIKTQRDFALRFGIKDLGTLTDWNKRIEDEGLVEHINTWARKLTPNVVLALYKNVTKHGKSKEVKTWFEIIENF